MDALSPLFVGLDMDQRHDDRAALFTFGSDPERRPTTTPLRVQLKVTQKPNGTCEWVMGKQAFALENIRIVVMPGHEHAFWKSFPAIAPNQICTVLVFDTGPAQHVHLQEIERGDANKLVRALQVLCKGDPTSVISAYNEWSHRQRTDEVETKLPSVSSEQEKPDTFTFQARTIRVVSAKTQPPQSWYGAPVHVDVQSTDREHVLAALVHVYANVLPDALPQWPGDKDYDKERPTRTKECVTCFHLEEAMRLSMTSFRIMVHVSTDRV